MPTIELESSKREIHCDTCGKVLTKEDDRDFEICRKCRGALRGEQVPNLGSSKEELCECGASFYEESADEFGNEVCRRCGKRPDPRWDSGVPPFIPSPMQSAFFDWIAEGEGNAILLARAGTGKTTSILHGMKYCPEGSSIAYAVFNKRNQLEAQEKAAAMGLSVNVGTFHSFGFSAWRRVAPRVKVDERGKWNYLLEPVPEMYQGFVKKLVSLAKQNALGVFGSVGDQSEWFKIVEHHDLWADLEEGANVERGVDYAIDALEESNRIGREVIDFDDMIYLPLLFGAPMWQNDWLFVDEYQDCNVARFALARKMVSLGGRICFVGDDGQAIYGFTGALNNASETVIREFGCKVLPLTVTYRCPKAVVEAARPFVGDYEAHESAPEGEVVWEVDPEDWNTKFLPALQPTDAILCRLTKPLVELAYMLIRGGIACHVEGRDIGANLMLMLTKWKVKTTSAFLGKLEEWERKQMQRLIAKGDEVAAQSIQDKADTLRIFCEGCAELHQVRTKIESLFQDTNGTPCGNVTLSTIHKAKGREWGTVFVLGFRRHMPSKYARSEWAKKQEENLIYVAFTRAKERLVLVG